MMKFSILIAHYNNAHYFKDCYESLIKQTYTNWEAIILDDASDDAEKEAVKNLADIDIAHPDVIAHWQTIADGMVPFGYVLQSVVDAERREAEKDFIRIEENPRQPEEIVKNGENEDGLCQC